MERSQNRREISERQELRKSAFRLAKHNNKNDSKVKAADKKVNDLISKIKDLRGQQNALRAPLALASAELQQVLTGFVQKDLQDE